MMVTMYIFSGLPLCFVRYRLVATGRRPWWSGRSQVSLLEFIYLTLSTCILQIF